MAIWKHPTKAGAAALAVFASLLATGGAALAAKGTVPPSRYASIVMDAETGAVLYERNADLPRYPASLTKIMTLYLTFEALASKKLSLTDQLPVSAWAAGRDPSRLDLAPGSKLKVEDAIRSITTKSANDAAAVLAEHLAKGSEKKFSEIMTAKGKALGMKQTTFHNASGLPDEGHLSSARDLAVLSRALIRDFPQYYPYCSALSFDFKGTRFPNQNRFLRTYYGADGIKTGFVNASGHNLAASAVRGGKRLIAIVLGGDSQAWTREHTTRLLDVSYAKIDPTLVMVASNASGSAAAAQPAAPAQPAAQGPNQPVAYATPAGAVTIASSTAAAASGPALPLPNATATLAAYAAVATAPKVPAGSVPAAPATVATTPAATSQVASVAPAKAAPPAAPTTAAPGPTAALPASAPASTTTAAAGAAPGSAPAAATAPAASAALAKATAPTPPVAANILENAPAVAADKAAPAVPAIAAAKPAPVAAKPAGAAPSAAAPTPGAGAEPAAATKAAGETTSGQKGGDWSVQVGLFRDAQVARRRGEEARAQMPLQLRGADLVVARANDGVHVVSRIASLSEADAREACSQLQRGRVPCVVVPPGRPLVVATN